MSETCQHTINPSRTILDLVWKSYFEHKSAGKVFTQLISWNNTTDITLNQISTREQRFFWPQTRSLFSAVRIAFRSRAVLYSRLRVCIAPISWSVRLIGKYRVQVMAPKAVTVIAAATAKETHFYRSPDLPYCQISWFRAFPPKLISPRGRSLLNSWCITKKTHFYRSPELLYCQISWSVLTHRHWSHWEVIVEQLLYNYERLSHSLFNSFNTFYLNIILLLG